MKSNYQIVLNNKAYCFDFDRMKEICFFAKNEMVTDTEITDVTSLDDEDEENVNQKIIKENKYYNTQTDVLMQDLVKLFVVRILEGGLDGNKMDFATSIAFNTCLNCGIIKEVND